MFVELHILQNFAPSNLNRDDTGAPKDCEFGGYRRARISSQCLKRAVRASFRGQASLLSPDDLAWRTKRLVDTLVERLSARGKPADEARSAVEAMLRGVGLVVKDDGKTEYLLFLGRREIDALAGLAAAHWDALVEAAGPVAAAPDTAGARRSAREVKAAGKKALPAEVTAALRRVLDGGKAADVALFGRMLADLPDHNVDAACQVAHAVSTNRVSMEFDFYTAVDDLKPEDTAGADMLGTVEFNSACFYRYANVDVEQLRRNLDDEDLARRTVEAFVRASVAAVPTGKQNSMAAQNPPSLIMAVARDNGLWSLANAFLDPVRPDRDGDLIENSIRALDAYWGKLAALYGEDGIVGKWVATLDGGGLTELAGARVPSLNALVEGVMGAVRFAENGARGRP